MSFIEIYTNEELSLQVKRIICRKAEEITDVFAVAESVRTMIDIIDRRTLYFKGSFEPCARVHAQLSRELNDQEKAAFRKRIAAMIAEETGIPENRMIVSFSRE